ncbi:hypothetical protein PLICRDRAFT_118835 [Plicaturopsis crispa FD-325 SS-3]|uniref:Auxin efflux carrier n=1 Tax=Plicaturopsis crispa FD-325 SS-3 TaxID=944288 RepID=A0A0C9SWT9_PLICR|nr:hypothetical protein PLICRDRAFT_118835 [Plicaturopsis crispa FD-325 SS-3]
MLSAGALIWVSLRPLIRLVICAGCGFVITRADIFPPAASAGAGQIIINVTLPCLMFSKIVPSFTSDNIGALGPLVLVAILYELIGITIAWIVKQLFWVPHRFRYGILTAGGWGNYGDIPTSVILSITGSVPFSGVDDQNLSVAYVAAFILVFFVTLFPLGGHKWIAMDYGGPEVEDEEIREELRLKQKAILNWPMKFIRRTRHRSQGKEFPEPKDIETPIRDEKSGNSTMCYEASSPLPSPAQFAMNGRKHVSFYADGATTAVPTEVMHSQVCSPAATDVAASRMVSPTASVTHVGDTLPQTTLLALHTVSSPAPLSPAPRTRLGSALALLRTFVVSLVQPASSSIILAFPIALVPTLKALFVADVPGTHIPNAPDGQPPLAFVMDTTQFIGAASVPLGLVLLGSALARLNVPRNQWGSLPLGAISALAVGKTLIMPVLGVLICEGLVKVGVIDVEDKVLRFVCIFFSCLPTATTQVFLTQVYSGTGSAEHLSAFLIPQYILMFISMVALTAYTLQLLF